ncbi:MAG: alpha-galactosidase [Clostridiales bacterium]|nr:alpha-galactosidase [Clostridiales bacterium]
MIEYDAKLHAFNLGGKGYSYCMYVNAAGYLQHLYFGGKISKSDLGFLVRTRGENLAPKVDDINADMQLNAMPAEIGSFGKGDFREATMVVRRADGAAMSRFLYKSHKIVKGAIPLDGMPCVRRSDETLIVTLKDDCSETEIDLLYSVSEESDVVVRSSVVRNASADYATIEKAFSFCLDLPHTDKPYHALRLAGSWGSERMPAVTPLAEGTLRIESLRGYSSAQMNPFLALTEEGCGEEHGACYGFTLLYSGSFALTCETSSDKSVRVQGGINDAQFCWRLGSGESFATPQAALCYSAAGLGEMSRAYHDFFRERIMPPELAFKRRPIVANNWEGTYFDFDADRLLALIDEAHELGIDTFVLDDGWFGKRDDDRSGLGDWVVNERKLRGGLHTLTARCKRYGMKFGLWFEPEMVSEDSDLYRKHPDWAIAKAGVTTSKSRNQLVLDFTKKEVVDYVFDAVSAILKNNDISYVKWDKNRDITENYSSSLSPDRQGEFLHRYTLGFYAFAERLTTAFPNVFFEGCASGGGRFDGGALYYFPQIWTSDNTDAYARAKIQYGTSYCYPNSSMSCHVSVCPNHQTHRTVPLSTRFNVAALGAFGYELDLTKLSSQEKVQVKAQVEAYKKIDALVLGGDLYRLTDASFKDYICQMLVSKDKTKAMLVAVKCLYNPNEPLFRVKPRGLASDKNYTVAELGVTASGKALMESGLPLPQLADFESVLWHIEECK